MKEKNIVEKIDQAIIEFYLSSDIEQIKAVTREEGLDLEKTADRRDKLEKRLRFLAQASLNKQRNQPLLEKAESIIAKLADEYMGKPLFELKSMLQNKGLAVQYRNIERLDEESIREMLKDVDLVQLVEKLEEDKPQNK